MIELLKTLRDTPVPSILVIGGIVFLLLAFVRKAGTAIEPEPSQRGWTILTGVILLLSGVSLYLVPPAQPVTTPTPTVLDIPTSASTSTSLPATAIPQIQATTTQPIPQPTIPQVATQSPNLIHGEPVSPEALARIVGGDAAYWTQKGPVVWVYSNKDHNTLMRHPGDNMILTYWADFGDPQNADDCQIIVPQADNLAKYVKCPPGTNAQIVADQVGLHLIDYTGYFP